MTNQEIEAIKEMQEKSSWDKEYRIILNFRHNMVDMKERLKDERERKKKQIEAESIKITDMAGYQYKPDTRNLARYAQDLKIINEKLKLLDEIFKWVM